MVRSISESVERGAARLWVPIRPIRETPRPHGEDPGTDAQGHLAPMINLKRSRTGSDKGLGIKQKPADLGPSFDTTTLPLRLDLLTRLSVCGLV